MQIGTHTAKLTIVLFILTGQTLPFFMCICDNIAFCHILFAFFRLHFLLFYKQMLWHAPHRNMQPRKTIHSLYEITNTAYTAFWPWIPHF